VRSLAWLTGVDQVDVQPPARFAIGEQRGKPLKHPKASRTRTDDDDMVDLHGESRFVHYEIQVRSIFGCGRRRVS
jgi:hypothetical protein